MINSPVRLLRSAKQYKANGLPQQYAPVILHRQRNDEFGIDVSGLQLLDTVLYVEFLSLRRHATLVITDSGVI